MGVSVSGILGSIGHWVTILSAATAAVVVIYAFLLNRFVSSHLPPVVRRLVNNAEVKQIVIQVAHQIGLDNDQKRQLAAAALQAWVKQYWHVALSDHLVNLALEIVVHQIKDDGIIPQTDIVSALMPGLVTFSLKPSSASDPPGGLADPPDPITYTAPATTDEARI